VVHPMDAHRVPTPRNGVSQEELDCPPRLRHVRSPLIATNELDCPPRLRHVRSPLIATNELDCPPRLRHVRAAPLMTSAEL
jgi:hypothetical protein